MWRATGRHWKSRLGFCTHVQTHTCMYTNLCLPTYKCVYIHAHHIHTKGKEYRLQFYWLYGETQPYSNNLQLSLTIRWKEQLDQDAHQTNCSSSCSSTYQTALQETKTAPPPHRNTLQKTYQASVKQQSERDFTCSTCLRYFQGGGSIRWNCSSYQERPPNNMPLQTNAFTVGSACLDTPKLCCGRKRTTDGKCAERWTCN